MGTAKFINHRDQAGRLGDETRASFEKINFERLPLASPSPARACGGVRQRPPESAARWRCPKAAQATPLPESKAAARATARAAAAVGRSL